MFLICKEKYVVVVYETKEKISAINKQFQSDPGTRDPYKNCLHVKHIFVVFWKLKKIKKIIKNLDEKKVVLLQRPTRLQTEDSKTCCQTYSRTRAYTHTHTHTNHHFMKRREGGCASTNRP